MTTEMLNDVQGLSNLGAGIAIGFGAIGAGLDVRAAIDREQGTRPAGLKQIAVAAKQRAGSGDLMLLSHWIASLDVYFSRKSASAACTRGRSTR